MHQFQNNKERYLFTKWSLEFLVPNDTLMRSNSFVIKMSFLIFKNSEELKEAYNYE